MFEVEENSTFVIIKIIFSKVCFLEWGGVSKVFQSRAWLVDNAHPWNTWPTCTSRHRRRSPAWGWGWAWRGCTPPRPSGRWRTATAGRGWWRSSCACSSPARWWWGCCPRRWARRSGCRGWSAPFGRYLRAGWGHALASAAASFSKKSNLAASLSPFPPWPALFISPRIT